MNAIGLEAGTNHIVASKEYAFRRLLILLVPATLLHLLLLISFGQVWPLQSQTNPLPVIQAILTKPSKAKLSNEAIKRDKKTFTKPYTVSKTKIQKKHLSSLKPKELARTIQKTPKQPASLLKTEDALKIESNKDKLKVAEQNPSLESLKELSTEQPATRPKQELANPASSIDTFTPPRSDDEHQRNTFPVYPRTSQRLGEEGTVVIRLLVHTDGSVSDLSIKHSSSHSRLDRAALKAVKHWRYQPATKNGIAIDKWHEQSIVFAMRKSS